MIHEKKIKIAHFIATGFYSGLSPVAPGTVGSLVFLVLSMLISFISGDWSQVILISLTSLTILGGVWSAAIAEEYVYQYQDPSAIVIDEWAGLGLCVMLFAFDGSLESWFLYGIGFILFRLLDILKPFPINRLEKMKGGWGIMLDDIVAGAMGAIILLLIQHWFF